MFNWLDDLYYNITGVFKKIEGLYYDITEGIHNLIIWFPIIWKDRDFDHYYILNLLHFKLKLFEKRYETHQLWIGQEKELKNIKMCTFLLKRLTDDNYYAKAELRFPEIENMTQKQIRSNIRNKAEHEHNLRKADFYLFTECLRKHSDKWWD